MPCNVCVGEGTCHHLHTNAGPLLYPHTNEALCCTHPCVTPEFAHDLPRCHIPQHHRLVPAAGAEIAVVKGPSRQGREGQHRPGISASMPLSRPGPGSPGRVQHLVAVATVRPQQRAPQRVPQLQGLVAAARQAVIAIHLGRPGGGYWAADLEGPQADSE